MKPGTLLSIAARYTIALKGTYLSTFLSLLSMIGIVLAITLLVIVLSVMNGFDKAMREHILGIIPQLTIKSYQPIADWEQQASRLLLHEEVTGFAPYVQLQGMLVNRGNIDTALVNGISLPHEERLGALYKVLDDATRGRFAETPRALVLGSALAEKLALKTGERATLILPSVTGSMRGPRYEYLTLVGLLDSGTELDHSAAFIHIELASELAGTPGAVDGFRLALVDLFRAPRIGWQLISTLPPGYYASDWTQTHGNLYAAIQLSRDMIGLLLLSIIAIAAFNVVSSLVLVVIDKQSDIAILRALGATPSNINAIFLLQGMMIALVGTLVGSLLGALGSIWVSDAVSAIEQMFSIQFLSTDVYPISYLPSDLRLSDLILINGVTVLMCFLAALYPARRAAKLPPADVLRHD